MSAVDVLAVLRRHAKAERERLGTTDNDTQAALTAVAELIEADKEYDQVRWAPYDRQDPIASREARAAFIAAQDRRAAALARVGGGK